MAASFDLPVIFVLENNGMSCGTLTASVCKVLQNLGDRAVAYGIRGTTSTAWTWWNEAVDFARTAPKAPAADALKFVYAE
jgi:hypothetical protein